METIILGAKSCDNEDEISFLLPSAYVSHKTTAQCGFPLYQS